MTTAPTHAKGLEGVIAGETEICNVEQSALIYRGYEIADLAENASFEEVAYLLLVGKKPTAEEIGIFSSELVTERKLPELVNSFLMGSKDLVEKENAVPMDLLRTAVSMLGHLDAQCQDNSPEANLNKSKRLLAKIPTIIGHMQNAIDGREFVEPTEDLSHAANLLYMMTGAKPSAEAEKVILSDPAEERVYAARAGEPSVYEIEKAAAEEIQRALDALLSPDEEPAAEMTPPEEE